MVGKEAVDVEKHSFEIPSLRDQMLKALGMKALSYRTENPEGSKSCS